MGIEEVAWGGAQWLWAGAGTMGTASQGFPGSDQASDGPGHPLPVPGTMPATGAHYPAQQHQGMQSWACPTCLLMALGEAMEPVEFWGWLGFSY